MPFDASITKSDSPESAIRNAKIRSYMGAKGRLANARRALHASIAEFERAIVEVDATRTELDDYLLEVGEELDIDEVAS
jgi:hypothetical protein